MAAEQPPSGASRVPVDGQNASPFTKDFDALVKELLEEWHVPGIAIAVVDGDETWSKVGIPAETSTVHMRRRVK